VKYLFFHTSFISIFIFGLLVSSCSVVNDSFMMTGSSGVSATGPAKALVSLEVFPPSNPSVPLGDSEQFTATGTYSDGSNANITGNVTWNATNGTGSATINSSGLASTSGGSLGTVTITATLNSITASTTMTVEAAASEFVYVASGAGDTISEFDLNESTGALTLIGTPGIGTATNWSTTTVTPNGQFLYAANPAGNTISAFSITPGTGALTAVSGTPFSGAGLTFSTTTPGYLTTAFNGSFLYAPTASGSIAAFSINASTGALTPLSGSPFSVSGATTLTALVTSANSNYLFATDGAGTDVFALAINPTTGALTLVQALDMDTDPNNAVIDMTGGYLYVTAKGSGAYSIYTINQSTNISTPLTIVSGSPFSVSGSPKPEAMAITPSNQYLYLTTSKIPSTGGTLTAYTIDSSTGLLTSLAPSPGTISGPYGVAVDALGKYLFATDYSNNNLHGYSIASNGTVTALSGSPYSTGNNPYWVTLVADPSEAQPSVTAVYPSTGQDVGGVPVVINGTNFVAGATVYFGSNSCTDVVVNSSSQLTCITPSGSDGQTTITVTNPNTLFGSLPGSFTYGHVSPLVTLLNLHNHQLVETGFVVGTAQGVLQVGCQYDGGSIQIATNTSNWSCPLPNGSSTWHMGTSHTIVVGAYQSGSLTGTTSVTLTKGRNKDINGDGYPDVVIGASSDWPSSRCCYGGSIRVFYGGPSGLNTSNVPLMYGLTTSDSLGTFVALDDINGDGYADIVAGDPGYNSNDGGAYIIYGGLGGVFLPEFASTPSIIGSTSQGDELGTSGALGDLNGDGYADVAVGGMGYNSGDGAVWIYYGSSSGIPSQTAGVPPYTGVPGGDEQFGLGLAMGDLNGAGYDDLVVGSQNYNAGDGLVSIFNGSSSGISTRTIEIFGTPDVGNGETGGGDIGNPLTIGDTNGDGYLDLAIGAQGYGNSSGNSGGVYIYPSSGSSGLTYANGTTVGAPTLVGQGDCVQSFGGDLIFGDFNGDGYADLAVANGYSDGVYIIYGSPTGIAPGTFSCTAATLSGFPGAIYPPGTVTTGGLLLSAVGIYGTAWLDLFVADPNSSQVYLIHGSSTGVATSSSQTAPLSFGNNGAFFGSSLSR
jgi:6-phosphogluconolactonase (cycloisomerase 2 family)